MNGDEYIIGTENSPMVKICIAELIFLASLISSFTVPKNEYEITLQWIRVTVFLLHTFVQSILQLSQ